MGQKDVKMLKNTAPRWSKSSPASRLGDRGHTARPGAGSLTPPIPLCSLAHLGHGAGCANIPCGTGIAEWAREEGIPHQHRLPPHERNVPILACWEGLSSASPPAHLPTLPPQPLMLVGVGCVGPSCCSYPGRWRRESSTSPFGVNGDDRLEQSVLTRQPGSPAMGRIRAISPEQPLTLGRAGAQEERRSFLSGAGMCAEGRHTSPGQGHRKLLGDPPLALIPSVHWLLRPQANWEARCVCADLRARGSE